jgi:hypothetical protein
MLSEQRIVTERPLRELWTATDRPLTAKKTRDLLASDIREALRSGPIAFVVADVGHALRWVSLAQCYAFWKEEAASRIADPNQPAYLGNSPGSRCYFASEWSDGESTVIVLEACH